MYLLIPAIATDWEVRLALVVAVVLRGVGRGLDCVGERMGFTGETATERGTGDMAHGVGVVGVLPPPDFFCRTEKKKDSDSHIQINGPMKTRRASLI